MIRIIFESHATSLDNEAKIASGHHDVNLSELGKQQAKELGERYKNEEFDAIFCSDLKRAYKTAQIAFANRKFQIVQDDRLRECDYGDLTRHPIEEIEAEKMKHITDPFPKGESYEQAVARVRYFLLDLQKIYQRRNVMIIGHRATQYGLEHWIRKIPLQEVISVPWRWQSGLLYSLDKLT
ncbi:histidine phosphatase family protein [Patescibacteria group bacterium]|nr:histidine phosphatase family protein [Patescibacteria group bacterium]